MGIKDSAIRFLRFFERYTKTDMVYLVSGTGWLGLGRGVGALTSLAATVLLANILAPEEFGIYKFVLSLAAIVAAFSLSGMNSAVARAVAKGKEGMLREGYRISMLWSGPMVLAGILGSAYYFLNHNTELGIALLIVAVTSPFITNANLYDSFFLGKKNFRAQAVYGSVYALVPLLFVALAAVVFRDMLAVVAAFFVSQAFTTWALYRAALRFARPNEERDGETIRFGKHLSLMNVLGTISFQLDRVLIFHFFGPLELALYSVATAAPQQLRYFSKVLSTLALPKFSTKTPAELRKSVLQKAGLVFLASVALFAAYAAFAPFLFAFLFPGYDGAVIYSQAYAAAVLFFPAILFQEALTAAARTRALYVIQTIGPFLKIVILAFLLPLYGVWGAIATLLIMELIRLILVVLLFLKTPASSEGPSISGTSGSASTG